MVAYASIAWLLRLVARHRITLFVGYRIALGLVPAAALTASVSPSDMVATPAGSPCRAFPRSVSR